MNCILLLVYIFQLKSGTNWYVNEQEHLCPYYLKESDGQTNIDNYRTTELMILNGI